MCQVVRTVMCFEQIERKEEIMLRTDNIFQKPTVGGFKMCFLFAKVMLGQCNFMSLSQDMFKFIHGLVLVYV